MNIQQFIKKFLADEGLCEQFPMFTTLANIALVILVSSASCEGGRGGGGGGSCQNRIKIDLRNRLSEQS